MSKFVESNEELISLHDCKATHASIEGGKLTLGFDFGIYVAAEYEKNPVGQNARTDAAEATFTFLNGNQNDVTVYVFTKKGRRKALREEWRLKKLVREMNNGKVRLEFLYRFKSGTDRVFKCCLWTDKKPHHKECELVMNVRNITYSWNAFIDDPTARVSSTAAPTAQNT